jgi:integrase
MQPFEPTTSLDDVLRQYVATNVRISSNETTRRYRTTVNNFARWLGRPATVADLTVENYGLWVNHRKQTRALGTVRGEAEKLKVIWAWVEARRGGTLSPMVLLPPPAETEPIAWTPAELARLENAARRAEGMVGKVPACVYWPAFLGVAVDSGERLGALYSLRAADFDLARRSVRFRAETRKGGRKSLTKPLSRMTCRHVRRLLMHRAESPFAALHKNSLYGPMTKLLESAGLPSDRVRKFHCLRKTHATFVHLQGGDATESLDHRDPRTTRRGYLDKSQIPKVVPNRQPQTLAEKLASPGRSILRRLGWTG